ncbi:MFS transporter [Spirulina sp. CCNP1310]|uniref:MFS transporter n=1 Tax=Spirulina sp. CCNP1310 TaxID=3110249 RepID=UPI002B1EAB5C|nr:MFS transporter [Spirulina sp. CCNP1310]MEA5420576.1 MFS transporter [Spirulina sp. CCNP1310]
MTSTVRISTWRVLGVAGVQAAITLGWVLYALYLPQLLESLGLAAEWAARLLLIEHGLEMIIEPIVGRMSDRAQRNLGTRYPWIVAGALGAATCFIGFPLVVLWGGVAPWLLIVVALAWASAMAVFRSPVMSLLATAAPPLQLPLAAGALTLAQQVIGALRFTAFGLILSLGPGFAFTLGSVVLLGAIAFLRWAIPPQPDASPDEIEPSPHTLQPLQIVLIIGLALSLACSVRFSFGTLGPALGAVFTPDQKNLGMTAFGFTIALAALPVGYLATRWGNGVTMMRGAIAVALGLLALAFLPQGAVVVIALGAVGVALSGVLNGAVPFVLNLVPGEEKGFGLGIYFGALGGGFNFFSILTQSLGTTAQVQGIAGAIALSLLAVCVGMSQGKETAAS